MKKILAIIIICAAFSVAHANGFGIKLDQAVNDHIANVDIDAYSLTSGEPVNLTFMLWNKDRTEGVDFDNVWVAIKPEGSFSNVLGGLLGKPDFGGFNVSYVFPKAGNYVLTARYGKVDAKENTETLAEATFPITVDPGDTEALNQSNPKEIILSLVVGLIAGVLIMLFKRKRA